MLDPQQRDWVNYIPNWLAAVAGLIGAGAGIAAAFIAWSANQRSKESIRIAREANGIAKETIKEELSGAFVIEENRPEQRWLQDWSASVNVQNVGGRDLQLLDLELTFSDGTVLSYGEDIGEHKFTKSEVRTTIKAQESFPVMFEPAACSLLFVDELAEVRDVVKVCAIDYKGVAHELPKSVAAGLNEFIKDWFAIAERKIP